MTEKTLKHELYKHGSYLNSLKESGSVFVNIDDEIKKIEELFQLASRKDHPPAFEVGEYYSSDDSKKIFKVSSELNNQIGYRAYDVSYGTLKRWIIPRQDMGAIFPDSAPATAEQIAIFKLAEIKSDIGLIIKNGDGDWIEIVEDIEEYLAEELREVEKSENI